MKVHFIDCSLTRIELSKDPGLIDREEDPFDHDLRLKCKLLFKDTSNLHAQIDEDTSQENNLRNEHEEDVHEGVVVTGSGRVGGGKLAPVMNAILQSLFTLVRNTWIRNGFKRRSTINILHVVSERKAQAERHLHHSENYGPKKKNFF